SFHMWPALVHEKGAPKPGWARAPGPPVTRTAAADGLRLMRIREEKLRKQQNNHTAPLKRRDVMVGAGSLAAGATLSFPAPAVAQGVRQLKMVTDWPEGLPGFYPSAVRFAQTVGA